jgi:uncharacterized membrane protein YgcG
MLVADATTCLEVSGKGELLEPADGVHAIGSGSRFAVAAARALLHTGLPPLDVARRAMRIAAERCIYTNRCVLAGWLPFVARTCVCRARACVCAATQRQRLTLTRAVPCVPCCPPRTLRSTWVWEVITADGQLQSGSSDGCSSSGASSSSPREAGGGGGSSSSSSRSSASSSSDDE